jgi:hypothetical protein
MAVKLVAIKLNHDPDTASTNAINLRKNATEFLPVPEWTAGTSVNPEDSRAAYSKAETAGHTLTIQAMFQWIGAEPPGSVEIRAVDDTIDPPGPTGCLGLLLWFLRMILRALFGNVLGQVKARPVAFPGGGGFTAYETFELQDTRIHAVGVGIRTTTWRWQYRVGSGPWIDFETTTHRIYVLLAVPSAPWQQTPYTPSNLQLPWTDVLDKACAWATLAADEVTAAGSITARIYDLGHSVITYDCPGGGSSNYTYPSFDCTAFLERIDGGVGNGQYVNCTDCATFVATFANAVGCDLWQSRMGWGFDLNPLLAIGSNVWQTACNWGGFSYHEVAWKGACAADDPIYDACLQVDGDGDPKVAPHTALLPTNMVFGTPGSGGYRDRLSPMGNCDPLPASRQRRPVS